MRTEYKQAKIVEVGSQFLRFEYKDKKETLEKMILVSAIACIEKGDA